MKKEIGKKIKEVREAKGLSQYAVGEKAGIQQCIIRNIENGVTAYSIDSFYKVCDALDINFEINVNVQKYGDGDTGNPYLVPIGYSIIITDKTTSVAKLLTNGKIEEEAK